MPKKSVLRRNRRNAQREANRQASAARLANNIASNKASKQELKSCDEFHKLSLNLVAECLKLSTYFYHVASFNLAATDKLEDSPTKTKIKELWSRVQVINKTLDKVISESMLALGKVEDERSHYVRIYSVVSLLPVSKVLFHITSVMRSGIVELVKQQDAFTKDNTTAVTVEFFTDEELDKLLTDARVEVDTATEAGSALTGLVDSIKAGVEIKQAADAVASATSELNASITETVEHGVDVDWPDATPVGVVTEDEHEEPEEVEPEVVEAK